MMPRLSHPQKSRSSYLPRNVYRRPPDAEVGPGVIGRSSPVRSMVLCPLKARCGACKYVNQDYGAGLQDKFQAGLAVLTEADVLAGARVLPPAAAPRELEYRGLFKLAVRPAAPGASGTRFALGLFVPGSHQVIDLDECPLHALPLKRLLRDLRQELDASALTPYDEQTGQGQVRYIVARSAHLTGEIMITFVVTEVVRAELRQIITNLQRRDHKVNSAHMNIHAEPGNAIFGGETYRLCGAVRLRERICGLDFEVGPTSFFQVNPWQANELYRRIEQIAGAGSGAVAWDLYCGTGQISLLLARMGYKVLGVEENEFAVDDARGNARRNHLEAGVQFLVARVEHVEPLLPTSGAFAPAPSLIVVNPSRRGLAESTRAHLRDVLSANPQARFIYVSCEVETLARDLKDLCRSGFQLRQVEPFDMFPQTDHMEWLAVLSAR